MKPLKKEFNHNKNRIMKTYYETLSQAVEGLQEKGYDQDLNLQSDCIECKALDLKLYADQFEIDKMHRFEGDSNPDDSSILLKPLN